MMKTSDLKCLTYGFSDTDEIENKYLNGNIGAIINLYRQKNLHIFVSFMFITSMIYVFFLELFEYHKSICDWFMKLIPKQNKKSLDSIMFSFYLAKIKFSK